MMMERTATPERGKKVRDATEDSRKPDLSSQTQVPAVKPFDPCILTFPRTLFR